MFPSDDRHSRLLSFLALLIACLLPLLYPQHMKHSTEWQQENAIYLAHTGKQSRKANAEMEGKVQSSHHEK